MSTANLPAIACNQLPPSKAIWTRFVWKEYRMLRGFWLAILVLGVLEQWVSTLMMVDAYLIPSWLFTSAWGAAALYAVGAAVTLFGAENEERTRGFLQLLPGRWQPIFYAKVAVAVSSSILLAGVLSLTGWLIAGFEWPSTGQCQLSLSVAGVAIIEATVWGLLFSLLWKQPLMAAVAAMAAASFGSQVAIGVTPNLLNSFSAESYQTAVPMRLAICLMVFAVDVLIGSFWLAPLGTVGKRRREKSETAVQVAARPSATANLRQTAVAPWRRRMFARLLWQTWRESWGAILAATVLGLLLTISCFVPTTLLGPSSSRTPWLILPLLILPALFGALVFRADQKRNHRLFLATHSARPRHVWLARQIVWLGALVVVLYVIRFCFWRIIPEETAREIGRTLIGIGSNYEFHWDYDNYNNSEWLQRWWRGHVDFANHRMVSGTWSAILAAYGIGQFFSLVFKREVLAGFLAILFSVLVAAWSAVVFVWQLNPLWFVLPLALGALLATWLRMQDWLVGKNSPRNWLLPGVAVGLPLLLLVWQLPSARLAQLDVPRPVFPFLEVSLDTTIEQYERTQATRQETALHLEQLDLDDPELPDLFEVTVDGKTLRGFGITQDEIEIIRSGKSRELSPEDRKVVDEFTKEQWVHYEELKQQRLADLVAQIQSLDLVMPGELSERSYQHNRLLCWKLADDGERLTNEGKLEDAWKRFAIVAHIGSNTLFDDTRLSKKLLPWAKHSSQSSEQIKSAIGMLETLFASVPNPREEILSAFVRTKNIILEKELPRSINEKNAQYFAFLANKLPWERERALCALEYFATQALNYVDAVVSRSQKTLPTQNPAAVRELLRLAPYSVLFAINEIVFHSSQEDFYRACEWTYTGNTSFLAAKEFGNSGNFSSFLLNWANSETRRRALLLEIALLAYRLDHEEYPETLDELVPEYLAKMPMDPYSGVEFEYRVEGLEYPLLYRKDNQVDWSELPADTPLFWSVGVDKSELEVLENYVPSPSETLEEFEGGGYGGVGGFYGTLPASEIIVDQPIDPGKTVYKFRETEKGFYSHSNLVFPLPVESVEAKP